MRSLSNYSVFVFPIRLTLLQAAINIFILTAAVFASVQFRIVLDRGRPLGAEYEPQFLMIFIILFGAILTTYVLSAVFSAVDFIARQLHVGRQFRLLIVALGIADIAVLVLLPDVSQLQITYFSVMTIILGAFLILIPGRLRQNANQDISILDNLRQIGDQRYLIQIWASHRIRARYTQTFLGIAWIVLFPILEALVMAFAFAQLLGRGGREEVPWVLFLLSGRIAFMIFQKIVMSGKNALQGMAGIVQQVYFPRELIILLLSAEVLIDFLFAFAGLVVIALFYGITPNIYYLFLPVPIFLMFLLSMAVSFVVAWLGLLIRDLQQLISVGMQLLFYITVLFDSAQVAPSLRFIPLLNPVAAMVEAFRSVVIYNEMPDIVSLYFPGVLAVALLYTGYVFYKVNEDRFTDYL